MATALDVAEYFLAMDGADGDMTNMKLQKLCSYAQALSVSLLGRPLFDEDLEAWQHGPVVPSVYDRFRCCGRNVIQEDGISVHDARKKFDDGQKFILELTNMKYSVNSATALRNMSHEDFPGPFSKARHTIPMEDIRKRFDTHPVVVALRSTEIPEGGNARMSDLSADGVLDALAF